MSAPPSARCCSTRSIPNWIAPARPPRRRVRARVRARRSACRTPSRCRAAPRRCTSRCRSSASAGRRRVLTSTLTFAATANAIATSAPTPVFVDVSPETWNLDPDLLDEELAAPRQARPAASAAVIPVDLYGQCADYARIEAICARYGVPADRGRRRGARRHLWRSRAPAAFGDVRGVLVQRQQDHHDQRRRHARLDDRRDIVERARYLATQAREPARALRAREVGYNYRLSNLLAAVGRGQLARLDATRWRAGGRSTRATGRRWRHVRASRSCRKRAYGRSNVLADLRHRRPGGCSAPIGEAVRLHLERANIESRPVWKPMHLQPVFQGMRRARRRASPTTLFADGLCLPSGSSLTRDGPGNA